MPFFIDQHGDGYISIQKNLNAIKVHYFSEDPQTADSWLLDPLDA